VRAARGAARAAQRAAGQLPQQVPAAPVSTRADTIDLAILRLRQGYLQNSWMMAGVQIRQIWNSARLDQNNRPVDQIGG